MKLWCNVKVVTIETQCTGLVLCIPCQKVAHVKTAQTQFAIFCQSASTSHPYPLSPAYFLTCCRASSLPKLSPLALTGALWRRQHNLISIIGRVPVLFLNPDCTQPPFTSLTSIPPHTNGPLSLSLSILFSLLSNPSPANQTCPPDVFILPCRW